MLALILLMTSFILLYIIDVDNVLATFWVLFLAFMILHLRKAVPITHALSRILIHACYVVMGISLFVVFLTDRVHLSFFITLLYLCLMMGIHQTEACLHATSILNKRLPQSGIPALVYGLLLAIALPIILTIALISPLIWMLTFPGGEFLIDSLGDFNINIGEISFNALQILGIATIFYLVKSIISVSCHYIDNTWTHGNSEALTSLSTPIKTTIFFGSWSIFILFVLQSIGFDLSNIAVIAGGLSVGIGLGMQGFVQNTFSGFLLIFGQNIREGDMVEVGVVKGIVKKVSLRATVVRTFDNAIIFVPNSEFMGASFTNWTHNGHKVRCAIAVGVAYGSDIDMVKNTILEVLKDDQRIAPNPAPHIFFMDFASSSLNFEVRFWVHNILDQLDIRSEVRFRMNEAFKEKGIEIPFPQTDLNVKTKELELLALPEITRKPYTKPRRQLPRLARKKITPKPYKENI